MADTAALIRRRGRFNLDLRPRGARSFVQARKAERFYGAQLRKIARHIGELVGLNPPSDLLQASALAERLTKYGEVIEPWARSIAERMIADVARRDWLVWQQRSREMGSLLHMEIANAPTGAVMREILDLQVGLIKSLPVEAGKRVHNLTLEGLTNSTRAGQIAQEIMRTGEVTRSRANTIARTEVSRTASSLTQARAVHVGSEGYIWRTSHDSDVRPSHERMEGRFVEWDNPPTLDGMRGHAGCLPNCRCYPEPVIPDF